MIFEVFLRQRTVAIRASPQPKTRRRKLALTAALFYVQGQIRNSELEDRTVPLQAMQLNGRQLKTRVAEYKRYVDYGRVYKRKFPSRNEKRPHSETSPSNKFHALLLAHALYVPCY
jgi:hypothetical protein